MLKLALAVAILCSSLLAQSWFKVTYYGTPCRDNVGRPLLMWVQVPNAPGGGMAALILDGIGSQFPTGRPGLILFGVSATKWGPINLPFQPNKLPFLPGCSLYASPDVIVATYALNLSGLPYGDQVRIPYQPGLSGKTIFVQGIVPFVHPQRGLLVAFSDAARVKF